MKRAIFLRSYYFEDARNELVDKFVAFFSQRGRINQI